MNWIGIVERLVISRDTVQNLALPGSTWTGIAVDPDGRPVAGATFMASGPRQTALFFDNARSEQIDFWSTTTNSARCLIYESELK